LSLDKEIHSLLRELSAKKAVILCGDLNVAHTIMDLHNPKANKGNAGFTPEERKGFSELLNLGFVDSFRELHPLKEGAYTWWSYRKGVRERNVGWRIDYILVSESLKKSIAESAIYDEVYGSDHCPIGVQIVPTKKRVL
ncbi:MAG: exodeoxyribonuclease III, partial [Coriobacteriia bacterium]|nr:exodeoxyribonuclease III [Coriobacteriia bacterium]